MFNGLLKKFSQKGKHKIPTKEQILKTKVHPARDWLIMFILFFVLNLALGTYSLFLFLNINSGDAYVLKDTGGLKRAKIDRTKLGEILADYENRSVELEALTANPPKSTDPSQYSPILR